MLIILLGIRVDTADRAEELIKTLKRLQADNHQLRLQQDQLSAEKVELQDRNRQAKQRIDLIGRIGLLDIHACLKRCAYYVGNDSGLTHIAAASGVPKSGLPLPCRTLGEVAEMLRSREITSVELTTAVLEHIAAHEEWLHAFIHLMKDSPMDEAKQADAVIAAGGTKGPMHGVPIALRLSAQPARQTTHCAEIGRGVSGRADRKTGRK